jgi:hypothetical protein
MYIPHTGKFFNRALLVIAFFTVLFATVHAADINLALGKSIRRTVKVLLIGVGAKICCTGNTDSVVAESIFTTIGAVVDTTFL